MERVNSCLESLLRSTLVSTFVSPTQHHSASNGESRMHLAESVLARLLGSTFTRREKILVLHTHALTIYNIIHNIVSNTHSGGRRLWEEGGRVIVMERDYYARNDDRGSLAIERPIVSAGVECFCEDDWIRLEIIRLCVFRVFFFSFFR